MTNDASTKPTPAPWPPTFHPFRAATPELFRLLTEARRDWRRAIWAGDGRQTRAEITAWERLQVLQDYNRELLDARRRIGQ